MSSAGIDSNSLGTVPIVQADRKYMQTTERIGGAGRSVAEREFVAGNRWHRASRAKNESRAGRWKGTDRSITLSECAAGVGARFVPPHCGAIRNKPGRPRLRRAIHVGISSTVPALACWDWAFGPVSNQGLTASRASAIPFAAVTRFISTSTALM